ncbi:murein biosynthesis integral membrane protein MurJ [Coxiella endosymbiont of Amblyomma americanum]|uniref:murein biosynthesis integral membrane protein MurJ n=1 Tax=Coxiella endosymbiont of Amblyomma americanum TaxID=325775 RepID=UPI0005800418|nr:murein biosynthesis integral membrane protein MurJ [Coxiella endosymbiont of Amblyomma americanum]AJC50484.1 membrane protein [Coxiella endosymbiont of Amblyomma americanum]AUJ58823.1 lipid II flippase MurJ [Coxiella-like endosymbiont of Amblyomma americanum]
MSYKLFKSTLTVSSMTFISRLLGFIRDVMFAMVFGASPDFDAFIVAFKIPNCMRRLFGEGAFTQAFVPILSEYQAFSFRKEMHQFIHAITGSLSTVVLLIVLLIELTASWITMVFAPGFTHDSIRLDCSIHMLRITSPYLLLITLTTFTGAVLNTFNRFAVSAFTPMLLNVVMIITVWFYVPSPTSIHALAWSVLVGGILQLAVQSFFLYHRLGFIPIPKWRWYDPGVIRVLKLMVPTLLGVSVAQISLLVDNFFASFLEVGSISWLYYSDRLTYLPLGIIGVALSTVVLPSLSWCYNLQSANSYSATLDWALRTVSLIGIPAAVALFILSGPVLTTLIYHGAFTARDVLMTQKSLLAFSVGLPWFMFVKVLASAFYARQNVKTPAKIAIIAMGINLFLNILLIHPLAHAGLALSTSLSSAFNAGFLLYSLWRRSIYKLTAKWAKFFLQLLTANFMMGLIIFQFSENIMQWFTWSIEERVFHLLGVILLGSFTYLGTLWIMGLRFSDLKPSIMIDKA